MVHLKVVSDGTLFGTCVVDAESGEMVDGVQAVTWHLDAADPEAEVATAVLTVRRVLLEVAGDAALQTKTLRG